MDPKMQMFINISVQKIILLQIALSEIRHLWSDKKGCFTFQHNNNNDAIQI